MLEGGVLEKNKDSFVVVEDFHERNLSIKSEF